ncbi:MAG: hypothetical protein GY814_20835, partial [Gammaproteobacteria bacterium]|nr:hypothetical protein [Gammaproteobacteria bacterium]
MRFDIDRAADEAMRMAQQHDKLESELQVYMSKEINRHNNGLSCGLAWVPSTMGNPGSVKQLNTILFGGTFKHMHRVTVFDDTGAPVTYKSGVNKGALKTKKMECTITIDKNDAVCKGYTSGLVSNKLGYVLDDSACKTLIKNMDIALGGHAPYGPPAFLEDILKYRKLSKDLNTY